MLRSFSSLCASLLAVALVAGTASANILLTAIPNPASGGPVANVPGLNLNALQPNQEFQIQITARAIVAPIPDPDSPGDTIPQTFSGADFTILAGGGGTFQLAVANNQHTVAPTWRVRVDDPTKNASGSQLGFGGWFDLPPQGGNTRQFSGGPNSTASFSNTTTTRTLGYIVLRAGGQAGTFNVSFSDLAAVNGDGVVIAGSQGSGFSYTVVPEPSSALLGGLAVAGLAFRRRRK